MNSGKLWPPVKRGVVRGGYLRYYFSLTALICVFLLNCDGFVLNYHYPDGIIQFEELPIDYGFRADSAMTLVFRTNNDYRSFCDKYWQGGWDQYSNPIPPPSIDFSKYMLIGIFWGQGFSGCRTISRSIESISSENQQIYVEVGPREFLGECLEIVYPFYVVKILRTGYRVNFVGQVPT